MANLKQIVIIREDLQFPRGLVAAQVAHLHAEPLRQKLLNDKELTEDEKAWLETPYIVVCGVPNVDVLRFLYKRAQDKKVPVVEWKDTVSIDISPNWREKFPDVTVGITLGVADSDKLAEVIGDLPTLK